MAGLLQRVRAWWNKDALEQASEETRLSEHERDVAEEDYEARRDDQYASQDRLGGGRADYERDSEPPRDETP